MQYNGYNQGYPMSNTQGISGVTLVTSIDEVRSTPTFGRQLFMNRDEQIFYVKENDGSIRCFSFEEVPPPSSENYVTRQEFDELRSKYEQLIQSTAAAAAQQQQLVQQPNAGNADGSQLQWNSGAGQAAVLPDGGGFGNDAQPAGQAA